MFIPEDFKTRLKIAKNKFKNNSIITNNNENSSFIGGAFKLGTELVSAVLVGTIIGFILDTWFDTKPWLIILFFFLGSVAGILNVIKVAKKMQQKD
jgi:ATP synthase protein I